TEASTQRAACTSVPNRYGLRKRRDTHQANACGAEAQGTSGRIIDSSVGLKLQLCCARRGHYEEAVGTALALDGKLGNNSSPSLKLHHPLHARISVGLKLHLNRHPQRLCVGVDEPEIALCAGPAPDPI